ncbi:hypothetical protein LPJ61_006551 [Coemansia biformis]|uniref:Uncharacterized protein n=1 Tax=Coemansia biformis TaxID=1286918 RepID=A0A9W7XT83_9FUNG|nr:hypothetical protein LPJ61_006564 [Coemansia biformis]KAJ1718594.1 hypothetical protein LPJ61_006551 [Coemansia biformis]
MAATRKRQEATGVPVTSGSLQRGSRPAEMVRGFELCIIPAQHLITNPTATLLAFAI